MIFYQDDWKYYPSAIADVDTKNTSFVRYAALLEKMGVKNNLFHLSLLDKDLVGVDPHDPNLDDVTKIKIVREVTTNIWYFLREVIKIPTVGSINNSPYLLNRLCGPFHWLYTQNISCFVIGPRQSGKSLCADVQHVGYLDIYCRKSPVDIIVNSSTLRTSSTEKRIGLRSTIPEYITCRTTGGMRRDRENTEVIECKVLGNVIRCHLASDKLEGAQKIGRGLTAANRQVDEGPHCKNIHISLGIAEMGGTAAIQSAIANGTPYGTCITTTPGDITNPEGMYMYGIYSDAMPWCENLYDCRNKDELMNTITMQTSGKSQMVNITMYHNNLGRDDDWLASEIIRTKASIEDIEKDLLLQWSKGNLVNPLSKETILRIAEHEVDPSFTEITPDRYVCRWYCKEDEIKYRINSGNYILSLDPSELAGNDMHGLVLSCADDMNVLMTCAPTEGNTFVFTKFIFSFLMKYPKVLFVPEAKSTGRAVIDTLIVMFVKENINPFKRIYSTIYEDGATANRYERILLSNDARGTIDDYSSLKKYFGIPTNKRIRNYVYSELIVTIGDDFGHNIKDRILGRQIRQLVMIDGRIDHPVGGHDDLVISWLLAAYVLRTSTNLRYYGIDPATVLRNRYIKPEDAEALSLKPKMSYEEELLQQLKQKQLRHDLKKLFERYKEASSPNEQDIIEYQINNIYEEIKDKDTDINSIGALLSSIVNDINNSRMMNNHRKSQFINDIFKKLGK